MACLHSKYRLGILIYLEILKHDYGNPKVCLEHKWMDKHLYTCTNLGETPRPPCWPIMIPQHPYMTSKFMLGMNGTLYPHIGIYGPHVPMLGMHNP